jgi:folate-binding Fe-S cluster repair protein YgfZ
MDSRVSFTKGCYLGQEIVARMHARGHPKQKLIGFSLDATGFDQPLPAAGSAIRDAAQAVIGSVTSSTYSPMRGSQRIGLCMVKYQHATDGATVMIDAEGTPCSGHLHVSMTTHQK